MFLCLLFSVLLALMNPRFFSNAHFLCIDIAIALFIKIQFLEIQFLKIQFLEIQFLGIDPF